jgi:hypothetical protein
LQYAINNRSEWERTGQEVVEELVAGIKNMKKLSAGKKLNAIE